jgi:hypothetical protein
MWWSALHSNGFGMSGCRGSDTCGCAPATIDRHSEKIEMIGRILRRTAVTATRRTEAAGAVELAAEEISETLTMKRGS